MERTRGSLADGRDIVWYDPDGTTRTATPDPRDLPRADSSSELRFDALTGDWVAVASHRETRTFMPAADECPLCASQHGRQSEIPSSEYAVVVFENRFPSLSGHSAPDQPTHPDPLRQTRPGVGRCEVVCFSSDHEASFGTIAPDQVRLVIDTWADRTAELSLLPDVEYVFPFENRGAEIGVTLQHPHGQIYAYPFVPPVATQQGEQAEAYAARHGRNLFGDLIAAERRDGERVVIETAEWVAFVPFAARWPIEVHLYPLRQVPDFPSLDDAQRDDLARIYLDVLGRLDRLYDEPTPYIASWQQAPVRQGRQHAWLHLELLSVRRGEGKIKYLAGSESGQGGWVNDGSPERVAARLRDVGTA